MSERSLLEAARDLDRRREESFSEAKRLWKQAIELYAWARCPWDPDMDCSLAQLHKKFTAADAPPPPSVSELKSMPYDQYLQTEHWQTVRLAELAASKGRCRLCNSEKHLHVHHRTYERRGEELPEDVTTLCADCHEDFHGRMPRKVAAIKEPARRRRS